MTMCYSDVVALCADFTKMEAELKAKNAEIVAQRNKIKRLQKDLRNCYNKEESDFRRRKLPTVELIVEGEFVNENLSGADATQQMQAYERFAKKRSLPVEGLDFRVGRLVPERRVRLAAIVQKLGPIVQKLGQSVQGVGQSGQEEAEYLD